MNIYDIAQVGGVLSANAYPGRGIILGLTPDAKNAAVAYFIMGRSENSRNRVFVPTEDGIRTEAFDPSKLSDPSLIIYAPVRKLGDYLIVTNGDQTDTIYDYLKEGKDMETALETREFEPDGPNWTPRISGQLCFGCCDGLRYKMSILKSMDAQGTACSRQYFRYKALPGLAHFIHTYHCDGNPIPTFQGEPERVATVNDMDQWTETIWNSLNADNKVSLFVRYIDIATGESKTVIKNKNLGD
ncbi:MAG: IMP cyclohydrolase [Oscillospiraceae bacterium]|nr:IMP cyclohydrolase [Oscillospiraceae bacterium]